MGCLLWEWDAETQFSKGNERNTSLKCRNDVYSVPVTQFLYNIAKYATSVLSCVKSLKLGTAHLASLGEATIVWNILNIWNNSWEVHYTESFEFFLLLCVSVWIHCNCCESKLPFCCRPKWRGKLGTFQGHLSNLKGGRCLTLKR